MSTGHEGLDAAVADLRARWGAAAPRTLGALALAPLPVEDPIFFTPHLVEVPTAAGAAAPAPIRQPAHSPSTVPDPDERVVRTGFAALDAILGRGGLPRSASVAIRGDGSSGRTTLALSVAAEAQATGAIVAWLDMGRGFDPVEAVSRGVRLEWLVVITPATIDEGLSIAGSLLAGHSVDLLVLDLPGGRRARTDTVARVADRCRRLAALARRAESLLLILDPPGLERAVADATGIRLELTRRSWIRLGRDVVGQRTDALVAHDRYGPSGRRASLRILYAEGGDRDACLTRDALLTDHDVLDPSDPPVLVPFPTVPEQAIDHATTPLPRAASRAGSRAGPTLHSRPTGAARAGRSAVGRRAGHRRQPGRAGTRRPAGHAAGDRTSAHPGGDLPGARPRC